MRWVLNELEVIYTAWKCWKHLLPLTLIIQRKWKVGRNEMRIFVIAKSVWDETTKLGRYRIYQSSDSRTSLYCRVCRIRPTIEKDCEKMDFNGLKKEKLKDQRQVSKWGSDMMIDVTRRQTVLQVSSRMMERLVRNFETRGERWTTVKEIKEENRV